MDSYIIASDIGLYGGRPPRYAPPLSSPVGAEGPRAAEQTATVAAVSHGRDVPTPTAAAA